jgi:hypothetical protein
MILQNRFDDTACIVARLEKIETIGAAYLRIVPLDTRDSEAWQVPLRTSLVSRYQRLGVVLVWFFELWVFMALPAILIMTALYPQLFCPGGCLGNGTPTP